MHPSITINNQMTDVMQTICEIPQERAAVRVETKRAGGRLPIWLKVGYTAFMAVLVPIYWRHYGPTNFLYFCDVALFLTLAAVWMENALLASMAAVGIVAVQAIWCVDFGAHLFGASPVGMTDYMFDAARPIYLRGLSLFHGWLPFMLIFLVARLGYDRRALKGWTALAWGLMLFSFFFLPKAGAVLANPQTPVNVNYVWGLSDSAPQTNMPAFAWLGLMLTALPLAIYLPTHLALKRLCKPAVIR
jgi:hypothetical protein